MTNILAFCFVIAFSLQCITSTDFISKEGYTVRDFFRQRVCYVKCGETSPCEGKKIKLSGKADIGNIYEADSRFFLTDAEETKYFIVCKVDIEQNRNWIQEIKKGKVFTVEGNLRSYDAGTNYACRKNYELTNVRFSY